MRQACGIAWSQAFIGVVHWAGYHGQNGAVHSVVEYDDEGRPLAIVSDCGLDTPVVDEFVWSEEGRFEALRWPNFEVESPSGHDCRGEAPCYETRAVYDDKGVLVGKESNGGMRAFEIDEQGRIVGDTPSNPDPTLGKVPLEFEYVDSRLDERRWIYDNGTSSHTFVYDDGGRLLQIDVAFAGAAPEGFQSPVFTWSGSTVEVENHESRVVVEVDAQGRPVHLDGYTPKDQHTSTIEWTWGDDGRLEEVFFEEWGR